MTTLIAVYNSAGCVGRCDARCYEAMHPDCDCICGGRNHGKGLEKATENTREMGEDWIEEYAVRKGLDSHKGEINHEMLDQLSLWGLQEEEGEKMMAHVLYDGKAEYKGYHGCDCLCYLFIAEQAGDVLVLFTETNENQGTSITNMSETLASRTVEQFHLDVSRTTFVERYSDEISYGIKTGLPMRGRDKHVDYSTVTYTWQREKDKMVAKHPQWFNLPPEEGEAVLARFHVTS